MSKVNLINQIKTLLKMEVKLEQMKLKDGETVIEADVFEVDNEIFVVNGEERIALPIGEYALEDGRVLVVAVEGIIAEIKEVGEPEAPVEDAVAPDMGAAPTAPATSPKKVIESISKEMFFEEIEKLNAKIEALKLSKIEVKAEAVELAEVVNPIIPNPESIVEKKPLNLYSQKRPRTTQDLVFEKINKFKARA